MWYQDNSIYFDLFTSSLIYIENAKVVDSKTHEQKLYKRLNGSYYMNAHEDLKKSLWINIDNRIDLNNR